MPLPMPTAQNGEIGTAGSYNLQYFTLVREAVKINLQSIDL